MSKRSSATSAGGGLGLGLFIAKTLLERSGASVSFGNAASPGQGAFVRVVWPRAYIDLNMVQTCSLFPETLENSGILHR